MVAYCDKPPASAVKHQASARSKESLERPLESDAPDIVPGIWLQAAVSLGSWEALMETDRRFYERRASEEAWAAQRAVTPEARLRHEELLQLYEQKARECALN